MSGPTFTELMGNRGAMQMAQQAQAASDAQRAARIKAAQDAEIYAQQQAARAKAIELENAGDTAGAARWWAMSGDDKGAVALNGNYANTTKAAQDASTQNSGVAGQLLGMDLAADEPTRAAHRVAVWKAIAPQLKASGTPQALIDAYDGSDAMTQVLFGSTLDAKDSRAADDADRQTDVKQQEANTKDRAQDWEETKPLEVSPGATVMSPDGKTVLHVADQVITTPQGSVTTNIGGAGTAGSAGGESGTFDWSTYQAANRHAESRGDDNAKNPRSSATGRYQFLKSTWLAYYDKVFPNSGLSTEAKLRARSNGEVQEKLFRAFTRDNITALRAAGVPVTNTTVYMAHHFGSGGAIAMSRAGDNARIASVLPDVIKANPHLANMTVGQWKASVSAKFGGSTAAPSNGSTGATTGTGRTATVLVSNPKADGTSAGGAVTLKPKERIAVIKERDTAKAKVSSIGVARQQVATLLKPSAGKQAVVGAPNPMHGGFGMFNVPGTAAADFQTRVDQVVGYLKLDEAGKGALKGVLSDSDMKMLGAAATRISSATSEKEFDAAVREAMNILAQSERHARAQVDQWNTMLGEK